MLITDQIALVKHIFKCTKGNIFLSICTFEYLNLFDVPLEFHTIRFVIVNVKSQSNLKWISIIDVKYKYYFISLSIDDQGCCNNI